MKINKILNNKVLIYILVFFLLVLIALWFFIPSKDVKFPDRFEKQKVISKIRTLSDLATVEYTLSKICLRREDTKIKLGDITRRSILFNTTVTLKAGLDLNKINFTSIVIDRITNTINLKLPRAKLILLSMNPENVKLVYHKAGLLRANFDQNEMEDFLRQGENEVKKNLGEIGIIDMAEKNAVSIIETWLRLAGYKNVNISF